MALRRLGNLLHCMYFPKATAHRDLSRIHLQVIIIRPVSPPLVHLTLCSFRSPDISKKKIDSRSLDWTNNQAELPSLDLTFFSPSAVFCTGRCCEPWHGARPPLAGQEPWG
jgi:hypothetical protein